MVIQSTMSPKAIVEVWGNTENTFKKYNVPISEKTLGTLVQESVLSALLSELNLVVGSSSATCIEGG
ncbi:hypothetical protein QNH36_03440 [Mesobacillus sp. AQ2]|uniref:hypothetical protein n=1 Tax=Bacillaceae TaxID=186817 RepID=UPI0011A63B9F|nr:MULTISPECIES: hypothetical protein [Bacillaceae]WHX41229.1 hypothetical protein QNH36_03440 [Mesobacillus sp. AQ2]